MFPSCFPERSTTQLKEGDMEFLGAFRCFFRVPGARLGGCEAGEPEPFPDARLAVADEADLGEGGPRIRGQ